ncbi:MAG: NUDIX domain-containing protein [Acidimicrobiales bacterium]
MADRDRDRDRDRHRGRAAVSGASDVVRLSMPGSRVEYEPIEAAEVRDVQQVVELLETVVDPWDRSEPLHLTASALVVHLQSQRVLLRWHERHGRYMQVGGHGDPGERDPRAVALREAAEETGLADLHPLAATTGAPAAGSPENQQGDVVQVVVVHVPARGDEAAHEHADLRYIFVTDRPDEARPENERAHLKWVSWPEAWELVGESNLRILLERARRLAGW